MESAERKWVWLRDWDSRLRERDLRLADPVCEPHATEAKHQSDRPVFCLSFIRLNGLRRHTPVHKDLYNR